VIRNFLLQIYQLMSTFFIDPIRVLNNWRALPHFVKNWVHYSQQNKSGKFRPSLSRIYYMSADRYASSGSATGHYFHQDLWAARRVFDKNIKIHVDVASRIDGFVAHLLTFCTVNYVDIRPLPGRTSGLNFVEGTILNLPFENNSVDSLSCLHVLEHIGLGRYGDPVDPEGWLKGAQELQRVVAKGGRLYFGTPVGKETLHFDAHRIFDPQTIIDAFSGLKLVEFSLIDDKGRELLENASLDLARACRYGCGLFIFEK
jgi:SAM-dependent methyltransferase